MLAEVARLLKASADELHPRFVRPYVDWVVNREDLPKGEWLRIGAALRKRWDGMEKSLDRISLGEALLRIYQKHSRDEHHLPFLRRQIERATEDEEPIYAAEWSVRLFEELLSRKWRDEHEAEAFQLLGQLSAAELTSERLAVQIAALHRLVDSMLQSRFEADVEQFQDQDHPEKLSRTEFAKKRVGYRKKASEGLVARLNQLLKIEPDAPREAAKAEEVAELHDWMRMERAWLDVRLDRNLKRVEQRCWTILGDAPSGPLKEDDGEADIDRQNRRVLRDALQNRAFVTVSYLAARRSARAKLVSRVLKYVDAGTKLNSDAAIPWKRFRFSLLVALDQPKELEQNLRQWIREDEFPAGWQLALARLQAERGLIDEAITLFETVERDAELSPADYTVLADWYLVSDKPERRRRARIEVFKSTEEWQISNWIRQKQHPWTRRDVPLPTELDENVLFAFQALFEKSNTPQSYVYQLREFYTASRDFRLLQMVADSIVGRTPQQVYPFLRSLSASLLNEVRNEATADKTLERLREVREKAESATDLRALDLLECLIERRAATVQNQPGPHVEAAVAALKRAFQREWADGEVRQMAEFLDSLNTISRPTLAEERLRQLRELHGMTKPDTDDGVTVAWHLAHALYWSHDRQQEALALMEIAVREFERARPNGWPAQVNTPLDGYADLLEASRRFASAEKLLNRMLENPANAQQRDWLWQRRNQLYANALAKDGQVSLGQRDELYRNLLKHLRQQTEGGSDAHRRQVVNQVRAVFRTAKRKEISGHKNDLRTFAFEHLPPILRQQTNNYQNLISDTGTLIKDVIDTRTALEFLIARFEDYPTRFEYSYQNPWQQFGYQMNQWFKESRGDARKLEPRLLALVLKELRRDLSSRRQQSRYFFHKNYGTFFWEEKIPDFRRVAEEVLKERSDSGRSVYHIAQYLYGGLRHSNRAIEIMLIAHQKKLLSPQMQYDLCEWLHGQRRYGEAIAILEPLVERYPDSMRHRVLLLKSYAKTSRRQQMNTLLAETDEHFRQQGRWTQQNIRQLADGCLDIQLFKEAVQYYGEGISLVERSHPTRGIGTALLSDLYVGLARSYSGRGMTKEAVKAASDAIVAWGPNAAQRSSTISWLNTVLSRAKDLDDYVKHLDAETEKNGTDSPLIRKGVGLAYLDRDQPKKAIPQFRAALQLQPNDTQTHDRLIFAYDNIGDKDAGLKQTLAWLELDRHNLEGYRSLAQRLKTNERPPELTERALTTIVEAAPNEAEHHQLLAEFREQQDQWPAAIEHWKQVARLRSLEPRGLLELAEAQIHEEQWKEAQKSIDELNRKEWPARFTEVRSRVLRMQQRIPKSK